MNESGSGNDKFLQHGAVRTILQTVQQFADFASLGVKHRMAVLVIPNVRTIQGMIVEHEPLAPSSWNPHGFDVRHY